MNRKIIALFLSLALALGCCAGFAGAESAARPVLTVMCAEPTTVEDVETNYATLWLEDKMNVDLQFNFLPSSEWTTKLEIMVSANEKLSDILFGTTSESIVSKYGANGVFLDLTPYYDEYSVYIKEVYEKFPDYQKLMTFADGKTYSVGRLQQQSHTDFWWKMIVNEVWLNNLGMEMPTTLDGFTDLLRAFRDNDPNGNGQKDEIPLTGTTASSCYNPIYFIMGSFTFCNMRHYFQVNDGVLNLAYATDEWREGLKYCKQLYDEGLLDPMLFTQDYSQLQALMQREGDNIVGVTTTGNTSSMFNRNEKMLDYVGCAPFVGPEGANWAAYQTFSISHNGFITKDAADPVLAYKFLDFTWNDEASMVIRYGEEGVDWVWATDEDVGMFESAGWPATFKLISAVQSGVQNKWFHVWSPLYLSYDIGNGWADDDDPLNMSRIAYNCVALLQDHIPDEVAGKITYTADESNEIAEIQSNLNSYFAECMTLFIVGDMDIDDEWEDYLAELKNIGIDKYLEVAQTAYTRTYYGN